MKTLKQLRDRMYLWLRAESDAVKDADFNQYVAEACEDVARALRPPCLRVKTAINTTTGQEYLLLPNDFLVLDGDPIFQNRAYGWLRQLQAPENADKVQIPSLLTRRPGRYAVILSPQPTIGTSWTGAKRLYFDCKADQAYAIEVPYIRAPKAMTLDTQVPDFDDSMSDAVEWACIAKAELLERHMADGPAAAQMARAFGEARALKAAQHSRETRLSPQRAAYPVVGAAESGDERMPNIDNEEIRLA